MASILSHHGVRLSSRPFHSAGTVAGGVVKLGGRVLVVIDSAAPAVEQLMAMAEVICSLGIEFSSLSSEARQVVERARARRRWRRKRLLGRAACNQSIWQSSRLSLRSPGVRACKGNERRSSQH
jgi:hypothetical protein